MQRLKAWAETLSSICVAAGAIWFVFFMQREVTTLNSYLAAIVDKMPDPSLPTVVNVPGLPVLADALKAPCKKDHRK